MPQYKGPGRTRPARAQKLRENPTHPRRGGQGPWARRGAPPRLAVWASGATRPKALGYPGPSGEPRERAHCALQMLDVPPGTSALCASIGPVPGAHAGALGSLTASCILNYVLFIEHDGGRLWSLWAKAGAVGNAQRCPRQARRCAAGASSTNPQPASVWRRSSAASRGGSPTPRLSSEHGAISSSVARTVAWAHLASCRCSPHVRQGWAYE